MAISSKGSKGIGGGSRNVMALEGEDGRPVSRGLEDRESLPFYFLPCQYITVDVYLDMVYFFYGNLSMVSIGSLICL